MEIVFWLLAYEIDYVRDFFVVPLCRSLFWRAVFTIVCVHYIVRFMRDRSTEISKMIHM